MNLGFTCYLPMAGSSRFSPWIWSTKSPSIERDKAFVEYIQNIFDQFNFGELDSWLEDYIFERLCQEATPPVDYDYDHDGARHYFTKDFDRNNFSIDWDGELTYEKNEDGSYSIFVNGKWAYTDHPGSWDDPPLMHLEGECWHKFSGRPRGSAPMYFDFLESDAEMENIPGIRFRAAMHPKMSSGFGNGDATGDGRGSGSGAGNGDGTGNAY